jgi:hypothetical protein
MLNKLLHSRIKQYVEQQSIGNTMIDLFKVCASYILMQNVGITKTNKFDIIPIYIENLKKSLSLCNSVL